MKTAYVFATDGSEEVETIAPVDFLRRAGVAVKLVGIKSKNVELSHGVRVLCDAEFSQVENDPLPDLIVLPGGLKGAAGFHASKELENFVRRQMDSGNFVSAICATPAHVLARWGIINGKKWTCYPGCESAGDNRSEDRVVVDGNLITACGPGVSLEFSVAVVNALCGGKAADELAASTLTVLPRA